MCKKNDGASERLAFHAGGGSHSCRSILGNELIESSRIIGIQQVIFLLEALFTLTNLGAVQKAMAAMALTFIACSRGTMKSL